MIDSDLLQELRTSLRQFPSLRECSAEESESLRQRIATKFVLNPNKIWWWESLVDPAPIVEYENESESVIDLIGSVLAGKSAGILIVTDDEPPPWPMFAGELPQLLEYIAEQRTMEFMLVDPAPTLEWLLFDTHHNTLVLAGSLARDARQSEAGT